MSTVEQTARAFAAGKSAKCHNAHTDGTKYTLHKSVIAERNSNTLYIDWCGFYTPTTAAHINAVLAAFGVNVKLSYSSARNNRMGVTSYPLPATGVKDASAG